LIITLLMTHLAAAECVEVVSGAVPEYPPASGKLVLRVRLNGHPASGVVAWIKGVGPSNSDLALVTDGNGEAQVSRLPEGKYAVMFVDAYANHESLSFEVPHHQLQRRTSFDIPLQPGNPGQEVPEVQIARFVGEVRDPSGAVVPGAVVVVRGFSKDAGAKSARIFRTGLDGKFAANLPTGSYFGLASAPGFDWKVGRFVISPAGTEGLTIHLNIGWC